MRNRPRLSFITVGTLATCSAFVATTCLGQSKPRTDVPPVPASDSLKRYLGTLDDDTKTRYVAAFRDLNGDGKPEAIVYLIGGEWCGTGGCTTLILEQGGASWRMVTSISITRPPLRVLDGISNGWRSIAVYKGEAFSQGTKRS